MNDAHTNTHTNALLAALEGQRNSALNSAVNLQAGLTLANARIKELEDQLAKPVGPTEKAE